MTEHIKRHWKTLIVFFILILLATNFNTVVYLVTRDPAFAANTRALSTQPIVRFSLTSPKYSVGDTITVAVLLSSPTQAINATAGEIVFPTDKLQITDISTKDSINSLWIPSNPYFSTTSNAIIFSGGTPSPGFEGVNGIILTLTFKAIAAGNAQLSISNLKLLANDGAGTQLDASSQPASIDLQNPVANSGSSYVIGDINHDGKINLTDLSILIANWGKSTNPAGDLDGSGAIDVKDLSILLSKIAPSR